MMHACCTSFRFNTSSALVGQPTRPVGALTPGMNLQYFEDDDQEPEEMEPNIVRSRDQRGAEDMEQNPPDQEVTVTSQEIMGPQTDVSPRNDVAQQRKTTASTDVQTSRYPKRDRRPPDFYGGFHSW